MQRAKPEALNEEVIPVLQASIAQEQLRQLVPVTMEDLDPLSEPEPSIGTLIQLKSGDLVVATYGLKTGNLLLQVPKSKLVSEAIAILMQAILKEIPIETKDITWYSEQTYMEMG